MYINKHLRLSNTKIINNNQYKKSITEKFNEFISFVILMIVCAYIFLPEMVLAASLEGQLDRIGGISTGKLKTIGISGATILSSIWAVVRGNIRLAGAIVAIGIILGFYLDWVSSGMKIN
ncbi:MAG: hypothetical protein LF885_06415 [Rickettsia endosymbiont of Culicoides impunctatus]|nr:MAG: hypothetical protein LF885_06415 [Rickettsia endosymbiont of Culicoides impunctatus]